MFAGPTPVRALGVTDQHSQAQLYMEGPFDKWFTLISVDEPDHAVEIPRAYPDLEDEDADISNPENEELESGDPATHAIPESGDAELADDEIALRSVRGNRCRDDLGQLDVGGAESLGRLPEPARHPGP